MDAPAPKTPARATPPTLDLVEELKRLSSRLDEVEEKITGRPAARILPDSNDLALEHYLDSLRKRGEPRK